MIKVCNNLKNPINKISKRLKSTIFALSSGSLPAGVAVIRISGNESRKALEKLTKKKTSFEPRKLFFTKIFSKDDDENNVLDHGMAVWMPGPRTFTGEDTVELYLHGSRAIVDVVCANLAKLDNFEHAKPGEFTKRAFFNGKYNVSQVESLNDLICAETESQRQLALKQNDAGKYLEPLRTKLIDLIANLEASIDFAEDVDNQEMENFQKSAEIIFEELKKYQRGAKRGCLIREGIRVALIGKTNVGKSSLMNRLAEKDVAIVSNISGTTRDAIETKLHLESVPVYIVDTAGIRETVDVLEKEGINRSILKAKESQIVVVVVDATENDWKNQIQTIIDEIEEFHDKNVLFCFNKSDLLDENQKQKIINSLKIDQFFKNKLFVFTSTFENDGLENLIRKLKQLVKTLCSNEGNELLLSRQRHVYLIDEAVNELEEFFDNIQKDKAIGAQNLRNCANLIGEISGTIVNEQILDRIFSQFCIGK